MTEGLPTTEYRNQYVPSSSTSPAIVRPLPEVPFQSPSADVAGAGGGAVLLSSPPPQAEIEKARKILQRRLINLFRMMFPCVVRERELSQRCTGRHCAATHN